MSINQKTLALRGLSLAVLMAGLAVAGPAAHAAPSPAIAAAIADPGRTTEDVAQDPVRHPAEVLDFIGVKPGDKVVERFPGFGYFTRLLSDIVGPTGKLYVVLINKDDGTAWDSDKAEAAAKGVANITLVPRDSSMPLSPEPVDVVVSIQNYHDLHVGKEAATGAAALNRMAFKALKPGGRYIVIDHAANPGAGATLAPVLHRIEMSTARAEVEAAGFRFVGSAEILRNPADPRTKTVSDPSVAGKTDRFMMKFIKPAN